MPVAVTEDDLNKKQQSLLDRVKKADEKVTQAEEDMVATVQKAREEGLTWRLIADTLDLPLSTVHNKFRPDSEKEETKATKSNGAKKKATKGKATSSSKGKKKTAGKKKATSKKTEEPAAEEAKPKGKKKVSKKKKASSKKSDVKSQTKGAGKKKSVKRKAGNRG